MTLFLVIAIFDNKICHFIFNLFLKIEVLIKFDPIVSFNNNQKKHKLKIKNSIILSHPLSLKTMERTE